MSAVNKSTYFFIFFCVFLGLSVEGIAQKSRTQLEKEKNENLRRIKEAEKILSETSDKKKSSLGQLNALNHQLEVRADLISSINNEIQLMDNDLFELNVIINSMEKDLVKLKKEYASMIYAAAKANNNYDKLTFIFSASSFNQFVRRVKYMQQYSEARKNQVEQINIVMSELSRQRQEVENIKAQKNSLLRQQLSEKDKLVSLQKEQNKVIRELNTKESQLKGELAKREKSLKKLDKLIADVIKEELEKRKEEETKKVNLAKANSVKGLSASFASNQRKLPWPVDKGFISSKFGRQPHPVLRGIMIDNDGVDIQTQENEVIKSVFSGKVYTVAFIPGLGNAVLVEHGEYFTVYAKLKKVMVKTGQTIKTGEAIGLVYTDKDGISELQFQVWKNSTKLDPQTWLSKK